MSFSPFMPPYLSILFDLARITTYQYPGSPYKTTFPYDPLRRFVIPSPQDGILMPYSRSDYPAYVYGSPSFYSRWILMQ